MRTRTAFPSMLFAFLLGMPVAAQNAPPAGVMGDLIRDVQQVEEKLLSLAAAMPEEAWTWRPGEGVRSTTEVFQHVAADNWLLGGLAGHTPPSFTGIDPASYPTVQTYESRSAPRDEVVDHLRQSFNFLREAMSATTADQLDAKVQLFGNETTMRSLWVLTTTHVHEHLGQLIAYARVNDVVPPWSR